MWKSTGTLTTYIPTVEEEALLQDTYESFLKDGTYPTSPRQSETYGGNPGLIGWQLIRYWESRDDAEHWHATSVNLVPGLTSNTYIVEEVVE